MSTSDLQAHLVYIINADAYYMYNITCAQMTSVRLH